MRQKARRATRELQPLRRQTRALESLMEQLAEVQVLRDLVRKAESQRTAAWAAGAAERLAQHGPPYRPPTGPTRNFRRYTPVGAGGRLAPCFRSPSSGRLTIHRPALSPRIRSA